MGYLRTADDTILRDYIKQGVTHKDRPIRDISGEELELFNKLRKGQKEMNALITEILVVIGVFRKIGKEELNYIIQNLHRIAMSLVKQRDFSVALKQTLMRNAPRPEEKAPLKAFANKIGTRVDFIRKTVLPGNWELTPVLEYLEITGSDDLFEDIYQRFGNRTEMYRANRGETDEIDQYAMDILLTVREHGLGERYKERLEAYAEREKLRKEAEQQVKFEERQSLAQEGMVEFQQLLHKSVHDHISIKRIQINKDVVMERINKYGRNSWVVLCTYVRSGKCVYRYAGAENRMEAYFIHARIFTEESGAESAAETLRKRFPDRIFEAVQLDWIPA